MIPNFFCDWFMRLTHHLFDKTLNEHETHFFFKNKWKGKSQFFIYKHVVSNVIIMIKWDAKINKKQNIISCVGNDSNHWRHLW